MIKVFVDHVGCKVYLLYIMNPFLPTHSKTILKRNSVRKTTLKLEVLLPLYLNTRREKTLEKDFYSLKIYP
jgi:hypothetical protein